MRCCLSRPEVAEAQVKLTASKNYFSKTPSSSAIIIHHRIHSSRSQTSTMIQRTLLRQSRALSSSIRTAPRTSLARPQFRPSQVAFVRPAAARWYSSEPEAKKDDSAEKKSEEAVDPVKKELEAKNKEITELKVRHTHFPPTYQSLLHT